MNINSKSFIFVHVNQKVGKRAMAEKFKCNLNYKVNFYKGFASDKHPEMHTVPIIGYVRNHIVKRIFSVDDAERMLKLAKL
jgi:hypothetical protein